MAFQFGVTVLEQPFTPDSPRNLAEYVRIAEGCGVTRLGPGDSQFYMFDSTITVTMLAQASRKVSIGLAPTNPITREPGVMASFLAGIDALSDGRAWVLMATGDSAVYDADLKPASRAHLEEYIACVRDCIAKGEGHFQGRTQVIRWFKETRRPRVPIFVLAEGPRMLHLAGRIADGVVLGNGVLPEVVEDSRRRIEAGAREAGRSIDDIELWWAVRPGLSESHEEALRIGKTTISSAGNHSMRFSLKDKLLPPELEARVQSYVEAYQPSTHMSMSGPNVQAMEERGLTDYFLRRFAVAGDPVAWRERLDELHGMGIRNVWFAGLNSRKELALFADKVVPHLRNR